MALLGKVLWTLHREEQSKELEHTDETARCQDDSPVLVVAQEVAQQLSEQDAHVAHDLCKRTEEAFLSRWCDLGYVDGYHDDRGASTHTRQ